MPIWKTLSDRKSKEHYFQFKQKNGFSLTRPEQVLLKAELLAWLTAQLSHLEKPCTVVMPESSNQLFNELMSELCATQDYSLHIMRKRPLEDITPLLLAQPMMKQEKIKLQNILSTMTTLKVALLPGNQRKRIEPLLFEPLGLTGPVALVDDSFISGTTFNAMKQALPHADVQCECAFYGFVI